MTLASPCPRYLWGQENPSFFEWPLLQKFAQEQGMSLISFNQGRTEHSRRKPGLEDYLDGLRGGGSVEPVVGGIQRGGSLHAHGRGGQMVWSRRLGWQSTSGLGREMGVREAGGPLRAAM